MSRRRIAAKPEHDADGHRGPGQQPEQHSRSPSPPVRRGRRASSRARRARRPGRAPTRTRAGPAVPAGPASAEPGGELERAEDGVDGGGDDVHDQRAPARRRCAGWRAAAPGRRTISRAAAMPATTGMALRTQPAPPGPAASTRRRTRTGASRRRSDRLVGGSARGHSAPAAVRRGLRDERSAAPWCRCARCSQSE